MLSRYLLIPPKPPPLILPCVRFMSLRTRFLQRLRKKTLPINPTTRKPNRFKSRFVNFTNKVINFRTSSHQVQRLTVQEAVDRIWSPERRQQAAHLPRRLVARWRATMLPHVAFGGASEGNTLKVYHDGSSCYRDMWAALEKATHCIKMEAYTFEPDTVGLKTIQLLENAAKRGVKVQLIYDCWGSLRLEERHTARLRASGGEVIPFAPLMRFSGRGFMFRNHRKLLLVDHQVAFAGGMNVGSEYAGTDVGGNGYYRDTHLQLHGPCVADLDKVFQDSVFEAYFSNPSLAHRLGLILPSRWRWWLSWLVSPEANYDAGQQFACVNCPTPIPLSTDTSNASPSASSATSSASTTEDCSTTAAQGSSQSANDRPFFRCDVCDTAVPASPAHSPTESTPVDAPPSSPFFNCAVCGTRTAFAPSSSSPLSSEDLSLASSPLTGSLASEASSIPASSMSPSSDSSSSSSSSGSSQATATSGSSLRSYNDITLQVLQSNIWREKRDIQRALCLALEQSHHKCYITNPYFLPPPRLKRALRNAIQTHGSDVRILMAGKGYSDVPVVQWACQHVYYFLLKHGARVFELQNKVLHAKTVTVDGVYASVGSFNFDNFSNNCNLELAVSAVMCPEFTAELERQFLVDISQAHEITLQNLAKRPWYLKLGHAAAYYITQLPTMFPWYPRRIRRRTTVA